MSSDQAKALAIATMSMCSYNRNIQHVANVYTLMLTIRSSLFGIQKHLVETTRVHYTARSMVDTHGDGYRDQIVNMSRKNIAYRWAYYATCMYILSLFMKVLSGT